MKIQPRCHAKCHRGGRCPDSAGYRRLDTLNRLMPGVFCRKHAKGGRRIRLGDRRWRIVAT